MLQTKSLYRNTAIVTGHLVVNIRLKALSLKMTQRSFNEVDILKNTSAEGYFV